MGNVGRCVQISQTTTETPHQTSPIPTETQLMGDQGGPLYPPLAFPNHQNLGQKGQNQQQNGQNPLFKWQNLGSKGQNLKGKAQNMVKN